jgi:hypothetical protein
MHFSRNKKNIKNFFKTFLSIPVNTLTMLHRASHCSGDYTSREVYSSKSIATPI